MRTVLDHVSLPVADPAAWAGERGFRAPVASRIHLDRTYLEVSPDVGAPLVFLRPAEGFSLDDALAALVAAGFPASGPTPYRGRDGTWLDVDTGAGPMLTVRTDRPGWPPPLADPHPNGALRLERVTLAGDREAFELLTRTLNPTGLSLAPEGGELRVDVASCTVCVHLPTLTITSRP